MAAEGPAAPEDGTVPTALKSGAGPDVVLINSGPARIGFLAQAGLTKPLDEVYKQLNWSARLVPFAINRLKNQGKVFQGKIWEVPWSLDVIYWNYNKDVYAKAGLKPPDTYYEMIANFEKLKAAKLYPLTVGVRSGFADPQAGWNDNSEAQYRLARRTCGFAARNFLANGISCILDDAVFPDRPVVGLGGWKRHVGPGLLPVVLLPGLDVVLERNAERTGNRRLTDEEVARIHGRMAGWYGSGLPIIDNSQLDVPGTARVLDEVLSRALASPPSW